MDDDIVRGPHALPAPALPPTLAELRKHLVVKRLRTLNDHVHDIHEALYEDPAYQRYLYAVYAEEAVEGSLFSDDHEAGRMIRQYASDNSVTVVSDAKLATIVKALKVVLRRYHQDRVFRRNSLNGHQVDGSDEG